MVKPRKRRKLLWSIPAVLLVVASAVFLFMGRDTLTRPDAGEYQQNRTTAITQDESTSLGRAVMPEAAKHPGQSGLRYLTTGKDSLEYRMALIQAAEKTIDLQYYTIHADTSGNLLLEALIRAAARGVRVRFLIDNISMGEVSHSLTLLDGIKNIEIRVFNPIVTGEQSMFSRVISIALKLGKATRRMHNKALIADNQLAIIGGRNLGDEYFDAHADAYFKDVDVLTAGPVTRNISGSFDQYWNSEDAFPITALRAPKTNGQEIAAKRSEMKNFWDKELQTKDGRSILKSGLASRLKSAEVGLIWAKAELATDHPSKIAEEDEHSKPLARMAQLLEGAKKEFIVVSPYFVPRDEGVEWLGSLVKRGIEVKVLTNSLASTDVVMVHTGYKRYRKAILQQGVRLYEQRAEEGKRPRQRLFGSTAPAYARLHSKIYVVDRRRVLVGSFNFDPRSIELNTELSLVIDSPVMAELAVKMFEKATTPEACYRVVEKDGDIRWLTQKDGREVELEREPDAGFWRMAQERLMAMLPVENQL